MSEGGSNNSLLDKAIEIIQDAIKEDDAKNYEAAWNLYIRAIDYFVTALKYEKNQIRRSRIEKKVEAYLDRAETLKKFLDDGKVARPNAASGGGVVDGKSAETMKLREELSSAIITEKPSVKWDDVAGLETAKEELKLAVILPAAMPELYEGRNPIRGILLYGPPGTGKSYLAKAVATEADATFFSVSSADLVSRWQGESERLVRNLFEMARENDNSIIFIDEIDSLTTSRSEGESDSVRRIKTEFLIQMQGLNSGESNVLVLGATNVPWELDPAVRRRFEKRIYLPLPDAVARRSIFAIHVGKTKVEVTNDQWNQLVEHTEGYSGSDISAIVKEALNQPLKKCQRAEWFLETPEGRWTPAETEFVHGQAIHPCPYCWIAGNDNDRAMCRNGHRRMKLLELRGGKLKVPEVTYKDLETALNNSRKTVAVRELQRFEEWTAEFGQEGI